MDEFLPAEPMTYQYDPGVAAVFKEGVATGNLVMWMGKPGPAQRLEVTIIADGEGNAWIEPTGEWQETTVVDDA